MNFHEFHGANLYTNRGLSFQIEFPVEVWNGASFRGSRPIPGWDSRFIAVYPGLEFLKLDCLAGTVPVVSDPLRKFIERYLNKRKSDTVEFLPLRLQAFNGSGEVKGYSILHPLTIVDCIDRSLTEVENGIWRKNRHGSYSILYGTTLKRGPMQGHDLFRVDGSPVQLLISDDFKDAIAAHGFTGCGFSSCEFSD